MEESRRRKKRGIAAARAETAGGRGEGKEGRESGAGAAGGGKGSQAAAEALWRKRVFAQKGAARTSHGYAAAVL